MFEQYLAEEMANSVLPLIEEIARYNLDQAPRNSLVASGRLRDSIEASYDLDTGDIILDFEDYGVVQDVGLAGRFRQNNSPFIASRDFAIAPSGFAFDIANRDQTNAAIRRGGGRIGISILSILRWLDDRGIPQFNEFRVEDAFQIREGLLNEGFEGRPWIEDTIDDPAIDEAMAVAIDRAVQRTLDDVEF